MRRIIFLVLAVYLIAFSALAKDFSKVNLLNPSLIYKGKCIVYKGDTIALGPKAFYIDAQLTNAELALSPYAFTSVQSAVKHISSGTETEPMTLYIAPWVYWIDNPDDNTVREPKTIGGTPFGLETDCEWLRFYGLTDDPQHVVLASNRGQTMGAKGNFTMFRINGNGTSVENVTLGNYCNIDLVYPLNPALNRTKRASAIVQAQLAFCIGDKILARNSRFVSRLNTCPMVGGKRTFFDHCHFESTDDAMAPTGVYLNCSFDFYSSKPFGHTETTGAVLLNCDIHSFARGEQYFVKSRGPVTAVDCRLHTHTATYWGWRAIPEPEARYYHYNNQMNGSQITIGDKYPSTTIDLKSRKLLQAYRFEFEGKVFYNTYNLLRGNDEWDPMHIKQKVQEAEKALSANLSDIPTQLIVNPTRDSAETNKSDVLLQASARRFGNYQADVQVNWMLDKEYAKYAKLEIQSDGSCRVIPCNNTDSARRIMVKAQTKDGLEAAAIVYVLPEILDAPGFVHKPALNVTKTGELILKYSLTEPYADQSEIKWYRCTDALGNNAIEVAVSRFNKPQKNYKLTMGDKGWFIMASISPRNIRSKAGQIVKIVFDKPVSKRLIQGNNQIFEPDFSIQSYKYQPATIPGFWLVDSYAPMDTYDWHGDNTREAWYYGRGEEGALADTGLVQAVKGARMLYMPVGEKQGNMKISFTAIPAKTAGQGFSSARQQYMDVYIKFDPVTLSGYALRIIRTTKYGDAVDFLVVRYENGKVVPVSEAVSTDCYRPDCHITMEVINNSLTVHAYNPKPYYIVPGRNEVLQVVDLKVNIDTNRFGGIGFQHTGTTGSGATLIKNYSVEWK